jgi:Double zinc ribbon
MIPALIVGTILALCALTFVLQPVFFGVSPSAKPMRPTPALPEGDTAIVALREIEFDRATGKLSDADYGELKVRYTQQAVDAMRRDVAPVAVGGAPPTDDELEAAVAAFRTRRIECAACGPRPEPDASFCSNCGCYLHNRCAGCGTPVNAHDARYCVNCGSTLAA